MTIGTSLPSWFSTVAPIDFGVFRAEFEDVADLHSFEHFEHAGFATRTSFARLDRAQLEPLINRNVSRDVDAAKVMIVFVGASGHVASIFQRRICNDAQIGICCTRFRLCADTAETTRARAKQIAYLFRMRRAHCSGAQAIR